MTAMSQSVTITENGKRKKISKIAAAVTQLANDAARGDKKSIQLIFAWLHHKRPKKGLVTSAAGLPSLTYSRTIGDDQNQL
jgi:Family of unknown function (DUF5681)